MSATRSSPPGVSGPTVTTRGSSAPVLPRATGLAADRHEYQRDFGVGADFRAALHGGPVIVGEIGTFKKEIALIGDAMNTTARILDACRDNGRTVLASATLLERLTDFAAVVAVEPLAPLALRGKSAPLEVSALERRATESFSARL